MKMSRRARRMDRHHRRHDSSGGLNLTSLMDVFTVLVFFLLLNSANVNLLPNASSVPLPTSTADEQPHETVVVMVTPTEILVQGERVIGLGEALAATPTGMPALTAALVALDEKRTREAGGVGPEVTILAAKTLPYSTVRRIMDASAQARYGQVSFAVLHRGEEEG
jgi:biopolymer transport protein ExbD